jgi:hypothetical protein
LNESPTLISTLSELDGYNFSRHREFERNAICHNFTNATVLVTARKNSHMTRLCHTNEAESITLMDTASEG